MKLATKIRFRMFIKLQALCIGMFAIAFVLHAEDATSVAPGGYSWLHIVMLNSEILKPDGWFVINKRDGFALSKKQMARGADFEAAILFNVYPQPTNMPNFPKVSGYLESLVNRYVKKENQIDRRMSTNGVCTVLEYRIRDNPKGGKT
jgi:hypothetical protein